MKDEWLATMPGSGLDWVGVGHFPEFDLSNGVGRQVMWIIGIIMFEFRSKTLVASPPLHFQQIAKAPLPPFFSAL